MSDENKTALDGRFMVVKNGDWWCVICDGAQEINTQDRGVANACFQLLIRAHELGRQSAFSDLRKLIGVAHG